jgi:hypothetical protein
MPKALPKVRRRSTCPSHGVPPEDSLQFTSITVAAGLLSSTPTALPSGGHALVLATPATASGTGKAVPVEFAQAVAEHLANRMAGQEGQWSMHLIESSAEWVTPPPPELLNSSSCHVPGALLGV